MSVSAVQFAQANISSALAVFHNAGEWLLEAGKNETGTSREVPDKCVEAASKTFTLCCRRLDALLGDDTLWAFDHVAEKIGKQRMLGLARQAEAAAARTAQQNTYFARLGGRLAKLVDGWAAYLESGNGPVVLGRGETIQAAIENFETACVEGIPPVSETPQPEPPAPTEQKPNEPRARKSTKPRRPKP